MKPILDKVKELLEEKRQATSSTVPNIPHMAIAIAEDTDYANHLLKTLATFFSR